MRDPGHGASRIRQRTVGQMAPGAKQTNWWTSHPLQTSLPALRRPCGGSPPSSLASPPLATTAAASRNLNELARAVVRAMLGFKCRQAVMQEPRSRHLASSTAEAAQLVHPRRSSQQLGAGADDPHTERKISMRPFSTCRTSWPTPKTKHATCS